MTRYDGLNLPDLMALMHGLEMPEPVAMTPQTPGWWIVLAWLFAVLLMIGRFWVLQRRRQRYRREALAEIKRIETDTRLQTAEQGHQLAAVIKRAALVAYGRDNVAALYGKEWAAFLCKTSSGDKQVAREASAIADAAYQPGVVGKELFSAARRWVRVHHA